VICGRFGDRASGCLFVDYGVVGRKGPVTPNHGGGFLIMLHGGSEMFGDLVFEGRSDCWYVSGGARGRKTPVIAEATYAAGQR
jgi:hypothetical protein